MSNTQRQGDTNSAGGAINGGVSSVRVNGRPIAVAGDSVTAHVPCWNRGGGPHCSAKTNGGSSTVKAGGKKIIRTSDVDTCGHPRTGGSSDVRVG